jgi:hypothetical protein
VAFSPQAGKLLKFCTLFWLFWGAKKGATFLGRAPKKSVRPHGEPKKLGLPRRRVQENLRQKKAAAIFLANFSQVALLVELTSQKWPCFACTTRPDLLNWS